MLRPYFHHLLVAVVLLGSWIPGRSVGANPISTENALTGSLPTEWQVSGMGDPSIQGFATDFSVNRGSTISFKIDTTAAAYRIDIYRLGYYGGRGARKVATLNPSASLPQIQPAFVREAATGLVDCGNWAVSASWAVPANATSGVYIARPVRTDTGGASHIFFVVRHDSGAADFLFQTSDTTWQAYNLYGGANLYYGNGPGLSGRASKVSYNRPFSNRSGEFRAAKESFLFNSEYPMIRWLEANGYNVGYASGVDTDRRGSAALTPHKVVLSVGHDEYWSGQQRANVESARAAGVHLGFFSANEMFWKTRWENSIAGTGTAYRTLVCYKETQVNAKIDPSAVWTGNWRDPRFSPPSDGGRPENAVTGQLFTVDAFRYDPIQISSAEGKVRFWRNTGIDTLAEGQAAQLATGMLGFEWDEVVDNGFLPAGLFRFSKTTMAVDKRIQNYGETEAPGIATHSLTLYRHGSGALVFGAGTINWPWGLDATHDTAGPAADARMQQATVNLFADMGVQPVTLQPGLVAATQSTDMIAPMSFILTPPVAAVTAGVPVTITGTATDAGGGIPAGVEFSHDGGVTWHLADGAASWRATWTPDMPGLINIRSRAVDDSGRIERPGPGITLSVAENPAVFSLWPPKAIPAIIDQADVPSLELGVRFKPKHDGLIKALRFYKCAANTGLHVGNLWTRNGTLLATATFTNETASGWQEVELAAPVPVNAGSTYVASYHLDSGRFSMDVGYFSGKGVDHGPLQAPAASVFEPNGVNHVGASAFPSNTYQSSNYWVDVVYGYSPDSDTTTPSLTEISPADGAVNVSPLAAVTARFGKDMAGWTIASANHTYPYPNVLFTFNPPVDSARQEMLRDFRVGNDLKFSLTQIPDGAYDVYVWTFEDDASQSAELSVQGNVVANYTSGPAGRRDRLGPFPVALTGGEIQVRLKSGNDTAIVSGLEVWTGGGVSAPPPPPVSTFYRAINLGGPAIMIDGHGWEANAAGTPDFTSNGLVGASAGFFLNPAPANANQETVLRTFCYKADLQLSLLRIPNGTYEVYVWALEDSAPLSATLSVGGNIVLPNYNTGPAGQWARLGPYPVTVSDGTLPIGYLCTTAGEAGILSGVEVWQTTVPLAPPTGNFYRGINVGGPAMMIDDHQWEAETAPNYKANGGPNPFTLKDARDNIVAVSVSYDPVTRLASLQPSVALDLSATYTATVKGGAGGVRDLAGRTLPGDVLWTFMTQGAPATPVGLAASSVSASRINLAWVDAAANETGFKIERKTGAGGSYTEIATLTANITAYSDTGLIAGSTYFYRVRATNSFGDSGYSPEASATTTALGFRAAASSGVGSGVLAMPVSKPAGTQQGDVMVASIAVRPSLATITAPSGWTLVRRVDNASGITNSLAIYHKVAGASEPASYSWSFSTSTGAVGGILSFAGIDTSNPVDVESGQATPSSLSHAAPAVTAGFANDLLVTSHAFSSSARFSPPAGMTEAFDISSNPMLGSIGESIECNYQLQAAAGSTGTRTATASNDADGGNAHALALKAAMGNAAPVADARSVTVAEDGTLQIILTGSDANGNNLVFAAGPASHGAVSLAGAVATYTPAVNYHGPDGFTFTVNDGTAVSAPALVSITVTPVNDAPLNTLPPPQTVADNVVLAIVGLSVNDADANLSSVRVGVSTGVLSVNPVGGATIMAGGNGTNALTLAGTQEQINAALATISYQAGVNHNGADTLTVLSTDTAGATDSDTVPITVTRYNEAPVADAQSLGVNKNGTAAITLTGSDTDGDDLTFVLLTMPAHGTVSLAGATATYTPGLDYIGPDSFSFASYDGTAASAAATVSINTGWLVNGSFESGAFVASSPDVPFGHYQMNPWMATGNSAGFLEVPSTVPASDLSRMAIFNGANETFGGTVSQSFSSVAGTIYQLWFDAGIFAVTAPRQQLLGVEVNGGSLLSREVPLAATVAGLAQWTPKSYIFQATSTTSTLTFTDKSGTLAPGLADVSDLLLDHVRLVAVSSNNTAPSFTADPITGSVATQGAAYSGTLAGAASDIDVGDSLTYSKVSGPNWLLVAADGSLSGTAGRSHVGPNEFVVRATDGFAGKDEAVLKITVLNINDAPLAVNGVAAVNEDSSIAITLTGSDPDGDPLTFAVAGNPAHGGVSLAGAVATYTPAADYNGLDSFTFTVGDGTAVSNPATISITVNPLEEFSQWLGGYGLAAGQVDDPDSDGIRNAVEYVIGGNPANHPDTGLLPTGDLVFVDLDGNPGAEDYLLFSWRRTHKANTDPATVITVEWSTRLAGPWSDSDSIPGVVTVVDPAIAPGVDRVRFYIPRSQVAGGRLFARLRVEITLP